MYTPLNCPPPALKWLPKLLAIVALALMCGCGAKAHTLAGTWSIREIPNDTWTFSRDGKIAISADNAPYDNGSYSLTDGSLQIRVKTERNPVYALTWLGDDKLHLSAAHVDLTLFRLLF